MDSFLRPYRLPRLLRVLDPDIRTKQEKCYNLEDTTLRFVDRDDELDFLYEGFKSPRALMSCGHAVTPTSLTNWCLKLLEQGKFRFTCGVCDAEWPFKEVRKMALLTPREVEDFKKSLDFNAARQMLTTKLCPGCRSPVERQSGSDLNVLCRVCTAQKGWTYEFCWQCLREWKGARPRKDRCGNPDCCNHSLKTLQTCPETTLNSIGGVNGCPSIRACPTCGLLLEHTTVACNSVECPRCDEEFCFVCLKSICGLNCSVAPRQTSIPVWQKKNWEHDEADMLYY